LLLDLKQEDEAQACAALARIEREEGRLERSIALFSRALELDPNDFNNRLNFSGALSAAGQPQLAEQQRTLAKEATDRHERLLEVLQKIEQAPEDADLRCQAGEILLEQGLVETGLQWLETALKLNPQHPATHRALADYYRRQGADGEADQHEALAKRFTPVETDHQQKGD